MKNTWQVLATDLDVPKEMKSRMTPGFFFYLNKELKSEKKFKNTTSSAFC